MKTEFRLIEKRKNEDREIQLREKEKQGRNVRENTVHILLTF